MHREDGHVRIKAKLQLKPKDWSDGIKNQRMLKIASNHQKLGEGQGRILH